jgi:type I restriction enzyme R subunit
LAGNLALPASALPRYAVRRLFVLHLVIAFARQGEASMFSGKDPLRETVFSALEYKPKLKDRKTVHARILSELKGIIQRFDEGTGAIEVHEEFTDFQMSSAEGLVHRLGDRELFFSDEMNTCRETTELAHFRLVLDSPYREELASLSPYPVASELLARGVVSETVLTEYIGLVAELQEVLEDSGFNFDKAANFKDGTVFWSFSEASEGSTVYEFVLNAWGYTVAIGGPIFAFLALYDAASSGFGKLKEHIHQRFKSSEEDEPSMIISKDLEMEFKRLKEKSEGLGKKH